MDLNTIPDRDFNAVVGDSGGGKVCEKPYNLSIYLQDNSKNFYKRNSKILSLDIKESHSINDLEQIIKSYEVDLNKSIDDFFK